MAAQDFGSKGDFGSSFGSSFGSKIFLEPLCFSIDSSILPLLLPMLPKNPQKVSRIGNPIQTVCKVRSRLEGFLGPFFLVLLVFWLQALSGSGVHSSPDSSAFAVHHWTSRGFTRLHGGAGFW